MNGDQNPADPQAGWQYTSGSAISANEAQSPASRTQPSVTVQPQTTQQPMPRTAPDAGQYQQPADPPFGVPPAVHDGEISWTASEFIAHQKSPVWYMLLFLAGAAIATLSYFLTKDWVSTGSIAIIAVIFAVYAGHKPRVLEYRLDRDGLTIGGKLYAYGEFHSFAVMDEGAIPSIVFMPLKRFMPTLTIYYDPKDEDTIVSILAERLPLEQRKRDAIDSVLHKIRF